MEEKSEARARGTGRDEWVAVCAGGGRRHELFPFPRGKAPPSARMYPSFACWAQDAALFEDSRLLYEGSRSAL
ncbi:MAG: hypothetical protein B6A08_17580 [Sorangiineae bacterium NIC37A_2]|nr:MAG: hypothetical protein B6A08_17580 [Sorangiineae bacterium NIC37A_2]